ncbi:MAG: hypothetical protein WCW67_00405 [Candidatus Margulisiibacteriota bacterium]
MQIKKLPIRLAPLTLAAALGATRLVACQAEIQKPAKPIIDALTPRLFTCNFQAPLNVGGFTFPAGSKIKTELPPKSIASNEQLSATVPVTQYQLSDEIGLPWHKGKQGNYQLNVPAKDIRSVCPEPAWSFEYLPDPLVF